jgi:hypothetical protein
MWGGVGLVQKHFHVAIFLSVSMAQNGIFSLNFPGFKKES